MRRLLVIGVLVLAGGLVTTLTNDAEPTSSTATTPSTQPSAFTAGPETELTETSARCKVNGPQSLRRLIEQLAALCQPSSSNVDDAWGKTWAEGGGRRSSLVIAGDLDGLAELLDRESTAGLSDTAAVTVGPNNAPADAVFINGPAFEELSDLGREVVLTHELVHVATRATGDSAAPTWLEEGYADYVAYRDTGLTPRQIAEDALNAPLPKSLPEKADFDSSGAEAAIAYGRSWAAVLVLVERLGGGAALKQFYESAAHQGIKPALRSAGFADEAEFVRAWRQEIKKLRRQ